VTGLWLVSYVALWVLFLAVAGALVSVLHNLGVVFDAVNVASMQPRGLSSNLKTGQVLPDLTWHTLAGEPRKVSELRGARQAFEIVSPTCGSCVEFLRQIVAGGRDPDPMDATLHKRTVVCLGDADDATRLLESAGITEGVTVMVDRDRELSRKWGITSTPSTVVVDEDLHVVRQVFGAMAPAAEVHAHSPVANGN
jgi:hypothetical protein